MKTLFKTTLCAFALSIALVSCNSETAPGQSGGDNGEAYEGPTGQVTLNLGFEKAAPGTQADYTPSTALPTTSWMQNIKDLQVIFVNHGGIKDQRVSIIREVPMGDYQQNNMQSHTFTFQNIPLPQGGAQKYDIYVVANAKEGDNIEKSWNPAQNLGNPLDWYIMRLKETPLYDKPSPPAPDKEADCTGYKAPAEIFIGSIMNQPFTEGNNQISGITLTRKISLMRVRINQTNGGNDAVNFKREDTSLRIRRTGISVNLKGEVAYKDQPNRAKAMTYIQGRFNDTDPVAGYVGQVLNSPNITLWKDIRILPGGSATTGNEKFDIVLIGWAPGDYIPLGQDKTLAELGATGGGPVIWTGAVQAPATANNILEVNLTLNSHGKWLNDPDDPGIPDPGAYGNVDITVSLAAWDPVISSTDLPL